MNKFEAAGGFLPRILSIKSISLKTLRLSAYSVISVPLLCKRLLRKYSHKHYGKMPASLKHDYGWDINVHILRVEIRMSLG